MGSHLKKMQPALKCSPHVNSLLFKRKSLFILLFCCFGFASQIFAQQQNVTGKITDEKSAPLIGATIKVSGSRTAVTTDANGSFTIKANKGQVLEISYVGKVDQQITIGDDAVSVVLKDQTGSDLNEVVVTGYMTQKKADLTGAVAVVSAKI